MDLSAMKRWTIATVMTLYLLPVQGYAQASVAHVTTPNVSSSTKTEARPIAATNRYTIGIGDVLNIQVWREKELSQSVIVRPDGKISLPLLEEFQVVGMEPSQLEDVIKTHLQAIVVEPRVTVTVLEIHSRMVYIAGEVARPGAYPLNAPVTVLQLIAQAGGITQFATRKKIHVIPADSSGSKVWLDYKALTQGTATNRNVSLNPGDTVVVP